MYVKPAKDLIGCADIGRECANCLCNKVSAPIEY